MGVGLDGWSAETSLRSSDQKDKEQNTGNSGQKSLQKFPTELDYVLRGSFINSQTSSCY